MGGEAGRNNLYAQVESERDESRRRRKKDDENRSRGLQQVHDRRLTWLPGRSAADQLPVGIESRHRSLKSGL